MLVSSNPTNLVLSGAFSISFVKYTAHVILPFLAAAVLVYPVLLYGLYRSDALIPRRLQSELGDEDGDSATLVDKRGAIFGSILLLTTLAVLVGTSTVGVPVWEVTVPPAFVFLLRDALHDWRHNRPTAVQRETNSHRSPSPPSNEYPMEELRPPSETQSVQTAVGTPNGGSGQTSSTALGAASPRPPPKPLSYKFAKWERTISTTFPTVVTIAGRLPIPLVPFAFLMFILVQALSAKGWVEVFAGWWVAWINKTGTIGAIGGMAFASCVLCNVSPRSRTVVLASLTAFL